MNADEYQKLAMRTAATPDLFNNNVDGSMDDVLHALLGIGTEAGELQDMLKKHLMYGKAFDRTNLVEECGDLLWYIALALKTVNVTMSDCMERNIKKLQVRYPQKFTTENALNRNLEQEARVLAPSAPAKPERVAVLRHDDGWHVYSDGSDDSLFYRFPAGSYSLGDYRAGEMVSWPGFPMWSVRPCFTALIDWPPAPAPESADDRATRIGRELDPKTLAALCEALGIDAGQAAMDEVERIERPEVREVVKRKQAQKDVALAEPALPAPEARTVAEARADVAREVKPERVAVLRHRDGWHVYSDGSDDEPGRAVPPGFWRIAPCKAGERRAFVRRSEPGDVFVALIDWPPAPAGPPSLWEWVRAATTGRILPHVSLIGVPGSMGALRLCLHRAIVDIDEDLTLPAIYGATVRPYLGASVRCTTPAELTAALDALAEETR